MCAETSLLVTTGNCICAEQHNSALAGSCCVIRTLRAGLVAGVCLETGMHLFFDPDPHPGVLWVCCAHVHTSLRPRTHIIGLWLSWDPAAQSFSVCGCPSVCV